MKRTSNGNSTVVATRVGKKRTTAGDRIRKVFADLMYPGEQVIINGGGTFNEDDTKASGGKAQWIFESVTHPRDIDYALSQPAGTQSPSQQPGWLKCHMVNRKAKFKFRNMARSNCVVTAWLAYPKRDVPLFIDMGTDGKTPTATYVTGAVPGTLKGLNAWDAQEASFFKLGFLDATQGTLIGASNKPAVNDFSATPYMSSMLTRLFKIRRLGSRTLCGGAEWDINMVARDVVVDRGKYGLFGDNTNHANLKIQDQFGYTKDCGPLLIIKIVGSAQVDLAGDDTALNNWSKSIPGAYAVSMIYEKSYNLEWQFTRTSKAIVYFGDAFKNLASIPSASAGQPVVQQQYVSI